MPALRHVRRPSASRRRLLWTAGWIGLGIAVHAAVIALAVPVRAQRAPAAVIVLPAVITTTVSSPANPPSGGIWAPVYGFQFDPSITRTVIAGAVDAGLEVLNVEVDQGIPEFTPTVYTVTLPAPLPAPYTHVMTITTFTLAEGIQRNRLAVQLPGVPPPVFTDTIIVQPPPRAYDVARRYPAVITFTPDVFTTTWSVGAADLGVITNTFLVGLAGGATYQSALSDRGSCSLGISTFTCVLGTIAPGQAPAHVTITALALAPGEIHQRAGVSSSLARLDLPPITTVVQAPLTVGLTIDIKPDSGDNAINPGSQGVVPVAILSSPTFDVPADLDQASLTFGRTGDEASLRFCHLQDVNLDALADLLCHFHVPTANFQPGDTVGVVKGSTFTGVAVTGSDRIRLVR